MDDLLREFLTETAESLDAIDFDLLRLEKNPDSTQILANLFRRIHTMKGSCGFLRLSRLEALTHATETLLDQFRNGVSVTPSAATLMLATSDRIKSLLAELGCCHKEPPGEDLDLIDALDRMAQTPCTNVATNSRQDIQSIALNADEPSVDPAGQSIPVAMGTLENLMDLTSELMRTGNQLVERLRRHGDNDIEASLKDLSNITAKLQHSVMKTWMRPIEAAWRKAPRLVRDLATQLGKQIDLEMRGADMELDRQVLEALKEPIAHMVRNSADHGIEPPHERRARGKSENGTIRLSAHLEAGEIVIAVADDGRGLDTAKIRSQAIARGLVSEAELANLSEAEIHNFIFTPGFSTASRLSNISGRGVGMDVVRSNVAAIKGTVVVRSRPGKGATIIIRVPLMLTVPVMAARAA